MCMIYIRAARKESILFRNFHIRGLPHIQMTMATPEWRSTMQHICTWSRCLTIRSVRLLPSMHKFETTLFLNKALVDNNFAPSDTTWQTWQNIYVIFHFVSLVPLCENMLPSTKMAVHSVLHCRQRMTELQPQATGEAWTRGFWDMWTDRQTVIHADYNISHPY